ncbi:hypothetical protein BROUX41_004881 [Berkeleyomyces rouxiae]|uniref:uncharacterized protein n=1 Tax=Berkeleyomyces rouxiae TaxID=2035830 RepID=UPI003B7F99C8
MAPIRSPKFELIFPSRYDKSLHQITARNACDFGGWSCLDEGGQAGIILVSVSIAIILAVIVYFSFFRKSKKKKIKNLKEGSPGGLPGIMKMCMGCSSKPSAKPGATGAAPLDAPHAPSPVESKPKDRNPDVGNDKEDKSPKSSGGKKAKMDGEPPAMQRSRSESNRSYLHLAESWQLNDGSKNAKGRSHLRVKGVGVHRNLPNKSHRAWNHVDDKKRHHRHIAHGRDFPDSDVDEAESDLEASQDTRVCQSCDFRMNISQFYKNGNLCVNCHYAFGQKAEPVSASRRHRSRKKQSRQKERTTENPQPADKNQGNAEKTKEEAKATEDANKKTNETPTPPEPANSEGKNKNKQADDKQAKNDENGNKDGEEKEPGKSGSEKKCKHKKDKGKDKKAGDSSSSKQNSSEKDRGSAKKENEPVKCSDRDGKPEQPEKVYQEHLRQIARNMSLLHAASSFDEGRLSSPDKPKALEPKPSQDSPRPLPPATARPANQTAS